MIERKASRNVSAKAKKEMNVNRKFHFTQKNIFHIETFDGEISKIYFQCDPENDDMLNQIGEFDLTFLRFCLRLNPFCDLINRYPVNRQSSTSDCIIFRQFLTISEIKYLSLFCTQFLKHIIGIPMKSKSSKGNYETVLTKWLLL